MELPIARYRFHCRLQQPLRPPRYLGSAWRGLLGHTFKRTLCVTRARQCEACMLYRHCLYAYLFETPNTSARRHAPSWQGQLAAVPHPFSLEVGAPPETELPTEGVLELGVTLFGHAAGTIPYWVHVVSEAGNKGLGTERARFALERVSQENPPGSGDWMSVYNDGEALEPLGPITPEPPPAPRQARLDFQTPLRLRREGRHVGPESFAFHDLFRNLLRRLSLLSRCHTDHELEADFRGLSERAKGVRWRASDLAWFDWKRYSARQQRYIPMGGVTGWAELDDHEALEALWPYLWLGQWVHGGKGSSMGMGAFRITSTES